MDTEQYTVADTSEMLVDFSQPKNIRHINTAYAGSAAIVVKSISLYCWVVQTRHPIIAAIACIEFSNI